MAAVIHFHNSNNLWAKPSGVGLLPQSLQYSTPIWRRRIVIVRCVGAKSGGSDYYSKLNLGKNATLLDIKTSFRKLARQYHPDMNKQPDAEEIFKEISAAYEVLSDVEKRSLYDRFGESGLQGEYGGSGASSQGVDPYEVVDAFFGGSNGIFRGMGDSEDFILNFRNQRNQDFDIRYNLFLSFEESIFGVKKDIEVSFLDSCDTCNGSGAKSSNSIKLCSMCEGRGGIMNSQTTPFGVMSQITKCSKCDGDGKIITDYCERCDGKGEVKSKRIINIVIPPGISDRASMKVRGEGNFDANRVIAGNLFLVVHVEEKQGILREGTNLYSKVEIDYTDAILGTEIKVETVEGLRDLQIPPGIQPGDTVKMMNMGVPNVKRPSIRGNHHFIVSVRIPKEISGEERVLVEKLAFLRSSFNNYSDPSKGKHERGFDHKKFKHVPSHGNKSASSLWSRIKCFARQRESGERFASVSVSSSQLQYSSPNRMLTISFSLVLGLAFIGAFTRKLCCRGIYRQKQLKGDCPCSS